MKLRILVLVGILFLVTLVALPSSAQQEVCPSLVAQALEAAGDICGGIGRNQACYGNSSLTATPRDTTVPFNFHTAGDVVDVGQIAALQLSALSEADDEWGVAVMAVQANLPDDQPGQNATIILFGDVSIENRGDVVRPLPDVFVHYDGPDHKVAHVRRTPSMDAESLDMIRNTTPPQRAVGWVQMPSEVDDGWWLRVVLDNGTDGWVQVLNVVVTGDATALPLSSPDDPAPQVLYSYGSMQAFGLKTGIGTPACSEAPADGIIIQTPDGAGEVLFEINQVPIMLGSTAVIRTTESTLRIALVEGEAGIGDVTGRRGGIPTGHVGVFELDANGDATGDYVVEPYTDADVANLPIALLPRPVEVRSVADIAALRDAPVRDGRWIVRHITASVNSTGPGASICDFDTSMLVEELTGVDVFVTTNADGTLTITHFFGQTYVYTRDDDGVWRMPPSEIDTGEDETRMTVEVEYIFEGDTGSATEITIYSATIGNDFTCTITVPFLVQFVGD